MLSAAAHISSPRSNWKAPGSGLVFEKVTKSVVVSLPYSRTVPSTALMVSFAPAPIPVSGEILTRVADVNVWVFVLIAIQAV